MTAAYILARSADRMTSKRKPRRSPAADPAMGRLLGDEIKQLRQALESEEPISDDELEQLEQALDATEPPRKSSRTPTEALTREALIAVYGARYGRGEQLWCDGDAVQRQGKRGKIESRDSNDFRFGRVTMAVTTPEGRGHIERAVVQGNRGEIKIIDAGKGEEN